MRRLTLTCTLVLLAFFALVSPAWADWVWPVRGDVLTPYQNGDDPYAAGQHRGIDIAAAVGTPVVAAVGGEVRFAGTAGSSGLTVSIRSADGRFDTSYLHLSAASVARGQAVAAGERIGAVGTSGTRSSEPSHLHFGVRDAGDRHAYHDPLAFLGAPPAGESPREAPAPEPAPVPVAPAPAPLRAPARRRAPAAREAPTARRAPADSREPAARPVPAARRAPAASPSPAARTGSATERAAKPARTHPSLPTRSAQPQPRGPRAAVSAPAPHPGRTPANPAAAPPPTGPDLPLLLGCLGLLAAAALLGLSEDGRAATRRSGRRMAAVLRPLAGRR